MERIKLWGDVLFFYGNAVGYVREKNAVVDSIFRREELDEYIRCSGWTVEWKEGVYDRLAGKEYQELEEAKAPVLIRIYQLGPKSNLLERFISWEERRRRGLGPPDLSVYRKVYEGEWETEAEREILLEKIWVRFRDHKPGTEEGHALTISDLIEVEEAGERRIYYLDRTGFQETEIKEAEKGGADGRKSGKETDE